MNAVVSAGRRVLPRGYVDLARQLAIWFGFYVAYELVRGAADRNVSAAFENARLVVALEEQLAGLFELSLQGVVGSSRLLVELTSWTYWLSQFAVLGVALLWVYVRRNGAFLRFRNTVLVANLIGLVGYVVVPTAPPRMLPDVGFVDTLALFGSINHSSAAIEFASNPYAAMPSLHAADSLIVGVAMALVCRRPAMRVLWLLWPAWVAFTVMATGNHFWLDIAAGFLVALAAAALVHGRGLVVRLALA